MPSTSAINSQCSPCSLCESYTRSRTAQVITMIVGVILLSLSLYFYNGMAGVSSHAIWSTAFSGIVLSTIPAITLIWRGCQNPTKALHRNICDNLLWKEEPNLKEARYLIKQEAKVNDRILEQAIRLAKQEDTEQSLELVRLLLDKVDRVDNRFLRRVMFQTEEKFSFRLMELLLAKVEKIDKYTLECVLFWKTQEIKPFLKLVRLSIQKASKVDCCSLLEQAIRLAKQEDTEQSLELVRLLLDKVDRVDNRFLRRVMFQTEEKFSFRLMELLLAKVEKIDKYTLECVLFWKTQEIKPFLKLVRLSIQKASKVDCCSLLEQAIRLAKQEDTEQSLELVRLLLDKVERVDKDTLECVLFWKTQETMPSLELVRLFIEKAREVDCDSILEPVIKLTKQEDIEQSLELVKLLLDKVERVDNSFLRRVMLQREEGFSFKLMALLLAKVEKIDKDTLECVLFWKTQETMPSLELVRLFIEKAREVDCDSILENLILNGMSETEQSLQHLKLVLEKVNKIHPQLLTDAIQQRKFQSALLLLDYITDVNAPNKHGHRALLEACHQKSLDLVLALLKKGADPNLTKLDANNQPELHSTPLTYALNLENIITDENGARALRSLKLGIEIDLTKESETQLAIVLALLRFGAKDAGLQSLIQSNMDKQDHEVQIKRLSGIFHPFIITLFNKHHPPLTGARCGEELPDMVDLTDKNGCTPLTDAAYCEELSEKQWENLIKVVPDLIDQADKKGFTPLIHAVKADKLTAVRALLNAGADATITDHQSKTARKHIHYLTNPEIVQVLRTANSLSRSLSADTGALDPGSELRPDTLTEPAASTSSPHFSPDL